MGTVIRSLVWIHTHTDYLGKNYGWYFPVPNKQACSGTIFRFFATLLAKFLACSIMKPRNFSLPARLFHPTRLQIFKT